MSTAQQNGLQYFFTTADFRSEFYDAMIKYDINQNLAADLDTPEGVYDFKSAFWPLELISYKSPYVKERILYAFSKAPKLGSRFQQDLLELVYADWPDTFTQQVEQTLHNTSDPKIFAMAAEYLWRGNKKKSLKKEIIRLLKRKFTGERENPILKMLSQRLSPQEKAPFPPLTEIMSLNFAPGHTVLYSFQRNDREYPGRVIVRRPDGTFVKDSSGKLFSVAQLALSLSNLPFYITNGNTPQGIYRMSGFDVSTSRFIGPTENIQMSMPFEIPADSFFLYRLIDTSWNKEKYRKLLPKSWKNYAPIYHSFYAGKAGRTAIIAHGTTVDPEYYQGKSFFPETPTLGCLCAYESWSDEGVRQRSDQQALVNAVKKAGDGVGYVVVINLDDQKAPVSKEEVEQIINNIKTGKNLLK